LILLGGPFAAAVLSKYAISTKTETGTVAKTTEQTSTINPVQGLAEVVSDDDGISTLATSSTSPSIWSP
jgi:hypothetical protein